MTLTQQTHGKHGFVYVFTFKNILIIAPPLIISKEQLDEGMQMVDDGLSMLDGKNL